MERNSTLRKHGVIVVLILIMVVMPECVQAQAAGPARWSERVIPRDQDTFIVEFRALLPPGWHIYSQTLAEGGPIPTRFHFEANQEIHLVGDVVEQGRATRFYDSLYETQIVWFADSVRYFQCVVTRSGSPTLSGSIGYMTCSGELCIPGHHRFNVLLKRP